MLARSLIAGLRGLLGKVRQSEEMDEELRHYLETAAQDKMRRGMSPDAALRSARIEMGSVESVKEQVRSVGWEATVESLWHDIRYSIRLLLKSPGFTAVAVLSLALGIGANTAIFTLINSLLLKTLPVRDPQQLVAFGEQYGGGTVDGIDPGPLDLFPYEFYRQLNPRSDLLRGLCAYASFPTLISVRTNQRQYRPGDPGGESSRIRQLLHCPGCRAHPRPHPQFPGCRSPRTCPSRRDQLSFLAREPLRRSRRNR